MADIRQRSKRDWHYQVRAGSPGDVLRSGAEAAGMRIRRFRAEYGVSRGTLDIGWNSGLDPLILIRS